MELITTLFLVSSGLFLAFSLVFGWVLLRSQKALAQSVQNSTAQASQIIADGFADVTDEQHIASVRKEVVDLHAQLSVLRSELQAQTDRLNSHLGRFYRTRGQDKASELDQAIQGLIQSAPQEPPVLAVPEPPESPQGNGRIFRPSS